MGPVGSGCEYYTNPIPTTTNLIETIARRAKKLTNMKIDRLRYEANANKSDNLNKGELVEMILINEFI
jgi:hypothetical protein